MNMAVVFHHFYHFWILICLLNHKERLVLLDEFFSTHPRSRFDAFNIHLYGFGPAHKTLIRLDVV